MWEVEIIEFHKKKKAIRIESQKWENQEYFLA